MAKTKKHEAIVGRTAEIETLAILIKLKKNVLIEGPVGVGKTFLVVEQLGDTGYERIDGDSRYTEQKMTGWFDPPIVLKKGYVSSAFVEGPLIRAMTKGRALFINELNRMPEAVQNILLPAMDERRIVLPHLGEVTAHKDFFVIATQNPKEFTATHSLSEALLDRFEMIQLDYQTREEEVAIVRGSLSGSRVSTDVSRVVDLIRATRQHAQIRRGASVRAAIAMAQLVEAGMDFQDAALAALPTRIELLSSDIAPNDLIQELVQNPELPVEQKKKG